MTVVLRQIPGLSLRELVEAVRDIAGPDVPIETGYGGIVVDESLALRFLGAYLAATGEVEQRTPEAEQVAVAAQTDQEQPPPPAPKPTRAGGTTRKKKAGEP